MNEADKGGAWSNIRHPQRSLCTQGGTRTYKVNRGSGVGPAPGGPSATRWLTKPGSSAAGRALSSNGLGLAIAQQIAQFHNTQIEVESAAGEGSSFRVRFAA